MTPLYPLRLKPVYKQYIWGGRRLATVLGRRLPPDGVFAESWDVCDHGHEQSLVQTGPLATTPLHLLVTDRGDELLGQHAPQSRFPLLLKYLDANLPLSVQVHPDDNVAARIGLSDPGKTEAWCVIQVEPQSAIWAGFSQPVDRKTLGRAIRDGTLERYLHRFQPAVGDCVFLPAGTVHALGAGLLVAEIQQTSDNTFRLYDWNRVGADGKPRPLHLHEGLEAIDYTQGPVATAQPRPTDRPHVERLVDSDKFILDRWTFSSPQPTGADDRCHILTVLDGQVRVEGDPGETPLRLGQTVLLPAALGPVTLSPAEGQTAILLDAYLP